jgi:hypothetical protein
MATCTQQMLTPAQTAKATEIADRVCVYKSPLQGQTIISQFERFCRTADPKKVGNPLYKFMLARFTIAHFNIQGWRRVYSEPISIISEVLYKTDSFVADDGTTDMDEWGSAVARHWANGRGQYVYTDGMADEDVHLEIVKICVRMRVQATIDAEERERAATLSQAEMLAQRLGMRLVAA